MPTSPKGGRCPFHLGRIRPIAGRHKPASGSDDQHYRFERPLFAAKLTFTVSAMSIEHSPPSLFWR
jgi:hypothetical protein